MVPRTVLALLLALIGCLGCEPAAVDSFQRLPTSVGGECLLYNESVGGDHEWAKKLAADLGFPAASLTEANAFTAPGDREYQSHILRIKGATGRELVRPLIKGITGTDDVRMWQEPIGGKIVTRYLVAGDNVANAGYAYAFDDVAIMILARRPQEALEALAQMP